MNGCWKPGDVGAPKDAASQNSKIRCAGQAPTVPPPQNERGRQPRRPIFSTLDAD
jgi:hypothetical protein